MKTVKINVDKVSLKVLFKTIVKMNYDPSPETDTCFVDNFNKLA